MTDESYKRSQLRLPPDLHEEIVSEARRNGRSMNSEIVSRLEQSFRTPGAIRVVPAELNEIRDMFASAIDQALNDSMEATREWLIHSGFDKESTEKMIASRKSHLHKKLKINPF